MRSHKFSFKLVRAKVRGQYLPPASRTKSGRGRRLVIEQLESRSLLAATWTQLANSPPAGNGTMELLTNGSVLMTDGGNRWTILTPNASGSYVTATWTRASNADYTRLYDATDVLQNGEVFVAGGEYGTGADTGEVYNPATNVWIQLPSQPYGAFIDSSSMVVTGGTLNGDVPGHAGLPFAERLYDHFLPGD